MKIKALIIIVVILVIALFAAAYVVDETEQVVLTQFGKAVGEPIKDPGLYFKIPWFQTANYFPKNLLEWDGDPGQVPTLDKTFISVDTFARWKIVDPLEFFRTVNNPQAALGRLDDIIGSTVRNFITSYNLIETVRNTNRELTFEAGADQVAETGGLGEVVLGRGGITKGILEQAQPKVKDFGILLIDVKIKRLNYTEKVRQSVYNRMIKEREQKAEEYRSEGQGEARKIEGGVEKELKQIKANHLRGLQDGPGDQGQGGWGGDRDLCPGLWQRS